MRDVAQDGATMAKSSPRGNVVMRGYYNDPQATAAGRSPAGWFHSAMVRSCIPDGYIEIRDRFKTVIISGGREQSPRSEVEGALLRQPGRTRRLRVSACRMKNGVKSRHAIRHSARR